MDTRQATSVNEAASTARREPAVAGLFYPGDPALLRSEVERLLHAGPVPPGPAPKVLIVPHAGYPYSGPVAASAYRRLLPRHGGIERVLLLGPAHRVWLAGMALPSVSHFATPLGEIPIDQVAWAEARPLPGVIVSDEAHRLEHSLEVQLPFLQVALGEFALLPVVVGDCPPQDLGRLIDRLWGGDETLIVVSSDLSHYRPYADARRVDAHTSERILHKADDLSPEEACGAAAINGLMASRHARALSVELLDLRNSGDTAGDRSRVVGYGAYGLH